MLECSMCHGKYSDKKYHEGQACPNCFFDLFKPRDFDNTIHEIEY